MRTLLLIACTALLLPAFRASADEDIAIGLPAPGFQLKTLNPDAAKTLWVSLERYVGSEAEDKDAKAVLLSFFASWCEPCKKEMPYLQKLNETYSEKGLRIIGVDIDQEEKGIEEAKKLVSAHKVTYPVGSDRFNLLARRYLGDQAPLPSVFIIRRDGTLARIERGYGKDASTFLLAEVKKVLGISTEPAPGAKAGKPKSGK
jgi:thiol-disulfide isomerase/thioredoxin